MRNGGWSNRFGKMAREKNEGNVTNFLAVSQTRDMTNLKWRIAAGIEYLRGILNRRLAPGINEFLDEE